MSQQSTSPDVPDDIDRALSDFFKGQLPATWPACRAVAAVQPAPAKQPDRDSSWSSRAALVASVALLLGLGFYFSSGTNPGPNPQAASSDKIMNGATANGSGLLNSATPAKKHADPMKDFPKIDMP